MTFIKAATTEVKVDKSQTDLITILRRYGARDFGFDEDPAGAEASVRFRITHGGRDLPVSMRVDVDAVYTRMYGEKVRKAEWWHRGVDKRPAWREQAKRTSWRLLVDWIDAACSTTALGIQSVEEVFLAHIVVRDANNEPVRLIEAFHQMQQAGAVPLALPAGSARP